MINPEAKPIWSMLKQEIEQFSKADKEVADECLKFFVKKHPSVEAFTVKKMQKLIVKISNSVNDKTSITALNKIRELYPLSEGEKRKYLDRINKHINDIKNNIDNIPNNKKQPYFDRYNALIKKKVEFVKLNFPDNPVLAMAIPCKIPTHTILCTAGSRGKIESLLRAGIQFMPDKGATCFSPKAQKSNFGDNEMGDQGVYFSKDEPAYLADEYPFAIKCETSRELIGHSLMPISLLKKLNFSEKEIDKGYDELQKKSSFIQHEGLPPADTEIVILRNDNNLAFNGILFDSGYEICNTSLEKWMENQNIDKNNLKLNDSWISTTQSKMQTGHLQSIPVKPGPITIKS